MPILAAPGGAYDAILIIALDKCHQLMLKKLVRNIGIWVIQNGINQLYLNLKTVYCYLNQKQLEIGMNIFSVNLITCSLNLTRHSYFRDVCIDFLT